MNGISVVTVTHNSSHILGDYLATLNEGRTVADQIVVVDSGSSDIERVRVLTEMYRAELIELAENVGFGAGSNRGVEATRQAWVALVNPDVEVSFGQLRRMVSLAAEAGVSCLGPTIINASGVETVAVRSTIRPPWRRKGMPSIAIDGLTLCESISGCCMVMEKAAFESIGGFDEYFFMFAEEIDLHQRIANNGGRVGVTHEVTVRTQGGASSSTASARWSATERDVAHVRYVYKHFGFLEACLDFAWRLMRVARGGVYRPCGESYGQLLHGVFASR